MSSGPLVSVVIPACNASPTLRRAIDSVLLQNWRPIEIIVVDDASDDDTASIAETYAEVRVVRKSMRGGAAAARNTGVMEARGELVAFQDADDEWLPGKLERQMAAMQADARVTLVACGSQMIGQYGTDFGDLYGGRIPRAGDEAWRELLARNTIATPSVLARRDELLALGGFDPALKVGEDQDMWLRLSMRGRVAYVDAPLLRVHLRPNSLSSNTFHDQLTFTMPMIERHLAAKRHELSTQDVRRILGERWGKVGRTAWYWGSYHDGLRLVTRAIRLGDQPMGNLLFLLSAAPPTRRLKQWLRLRRGAPAAKLSSAPMPGQA